MIGLTRSIKKSLGKGLFAIENDDEGHPCVCGIHLKVYQSTPDVPSMPENHLDQVPVTSLREALADPDVVVTSTPERCHSKPRQHFLPFVQIFNPNGCHWVVASTIGCSAGCVRLYDSSLKKTTDEATNKILSILLQTSERWR